MIKQTWVICPFDYNATKGDFVTSIERIKKSFIKNGFNIGKYKIDIIQNIIFIEKIKSNVRK